MMSRFKVFIQLGLSTGLILNFAQATGNQVGNGGHLVVCGRGLGAKLQLLDLYEAGAPLVPRVRRSEEFETGIKSAQLLAEKKLKALENVHPALAAQFRGRLESLTQEIEFRPHVQLSFTGDSFQLALPSGPDCRLEQFAIRIAEPEREQKLFLISKDLWAAASPESRAALLLHETIYEYFFKLGESDSRKARRFNARLLSGTAKGFAQMSVPDYWKYMGELKIPIYPSVQIKN